MGAGNDPRKVEWPWARDVIFNDMQQEQFCVELGCQLDADRYCTR